MGGARFEPKRKEILITGDNWMLPGVGNYKNKDFKRKKENTVLTKKTRS